MDPWYESQADISGVCDIGSHSLYYELRGIKNAAKLVMIMGLGMTTKLYNQLADRFAQDFQVLTFNSRGVRTSTVPLQNSGVTCDDFAKDTLKLLDELWPGEPVNVLGSSLGGFIALRLALLLLPQKRIQALFLSVTAPYVSPALPLPTWLFRVLMPLLIPQEPKKMARVMLEQNMSKEAYGRPWKDRDGIEGPVGAQWERRWAEEFEDWFCMHNHSTVAMQMRALHRFRLPIADAQTLHSSKVPIMAEIAPEDKLIHTRLQRQLANMLQCDTVECKDSGHLAFMTDYDANSPRPLQWLLRVQQPVSHASGPQH